MPQVLELKADSFAIVEDDLWWPGRFDSVGTARRASTFQEDVLARLQAQKNAETGGDHGVITDGDLDALSRGF